MKNESGAPSGGERRFTAPSPYDEETKEIKITNEQDSAEPSHEQEKRVEIDPVEAFGATVAAKLPKELLDRINKSDKLYFIAADMMKSGVGAKLDKNPDLAAKLLRGFGVNIDEAAPTQAPAATGEQRPPQIARPDTQPAPSDGPESDDDYDEDDYADGDDEMVRQELQDDSKFNKFGANAYVAQTRMLGKFAEWRQKRAAKRREKYIQQFHEDNPGEGASQADIEAYVDARENKRRKSLIIVAGSVAVAAATGFVAWKVFGGEHGGGGGVTPDQHPDAPNAENFNDYFNTPDVSKLTDKLHHANDFSPGNIPLSNLDKQGAIDNLSEMFRGNPNITASWASQMDIPGAPKMPDLSTLQNSDAAVIKYNQEVSAWADTLRNDPALRKQVTEQMLTALKDGNLGDKITLRPGYLSEGSNNTLATSIYGTKPGETFVDPSVGYSNVEAVEWKLPNGKTILVETGCNQLAMQGPEPVYQAPVQTYNAAPAQHYDTTPTPQRHTPPAEQTPNTPDTPGTTPPDNTPDTPTDTTPEPEPTPNTVKGMERNDGTPNILGSGELKVPDAVQQFLDTPATTGGAPIHDTLNTPLQTETGAGMNTGVQTPDITSGPTGNADLGGPQSGITTSP